MTNEELKRNLNMLEIQTSFDIDSITLSDVRNAFKRLAIILHPDKAGPESTAAFQTLRNAYEKIRDHFNERNANGDVSNINDEEEDTFFDENFETFNFPFENKGSFTVKIEESLAHGWKEAISC